MIIDLDRFIHEERPLWIELSAMLDRLEGMAETRLTLEEVERLYYLYERAGAALGRIQTFAVDSATHEYLESLVARAYAEVHEVRDPRGWRSFLDLVWVRFPAAFRRRLGAFWVAVGVTVAGVVLGAVVTVVDPESRRVTLPFGHDRLDPVQRVMREEGQRGAAIAGVEAQFSSYLMTHNIQVSILTLALGVTCGVGTVILLFYNGVMLGAIVVDYLGAGQGVFLAGWLLPHGTIEIPAILIAGQAGLVMAGAILGRGDRAGLRERLAAAGRDILPLMAGVAVMLVWAGLVESFLSQYHEPAVPYAAKIAFGLVEAILLGVFLVRAGRGGLDTTREERA